MNQKTFFLITFGIIIFGLRLFNLNEAIYDDESNSAYSLTVMNELGFNEKYYSPTPLNLLYKPFIALFGLETWVFRLVPWLFGIINTIFVYVFARRHWNKEAAFWSAFLMLFAFYPTLASLQFDVEGNLVMFSVTLMFFAYLEYERCKDKNNDNNKSKDRSKRKELGWQILSGIGLGIAVICKYNSIYIVAILALYSLMRGKWKVKETFNDLFMIYLVGFILFLSYLLLGAVSSPENWLDATNILGWRVGFDQAYHPSSVSILSLAIYLLWATLLLFGGYVISVVEKIKDKINGGFKEQKTVKEREINTKSNQTEGNSGLSLILILWVSAALLFYTFFMNNGSIDRYLMNTIPALVILGGVLVSKMKLGKRHYLFGSLIFGVSTLLLFLINFVNFSTMKYLPRFPELYQKELLNLNLNFLFAYTSASGPTFGINFTTFFWSFLIASICLSFYLFLNQRRNAISKYFFIIFFSVSLAFNIFLVSEYLFHPTGPDVSEVKWQMLDYVNKNNLLYPIYTNDQGIQWYFERDYLWQNKITQGFGDNEIGSDTSKARERIKTEGGTILLLHWPPLPDKSPAWDIVKWCKINKQFYSKKVLAGEVYVC